jgi:hypothetical protein
MTVFPPRFESGYPRTCGLRSPGPSEKRWPKIIVRAATFERMRASHLERMKVTLKAFVLALVLQLAAGSLMVHAEWLPGNTAQATAACHQHTHKAPSPQPRNFVCCLSGHDAAILQASSIIGLSCDGQLVVAGIAPHTTSASICAIGPLLSISPGDPPVIPALRI